MSQISLIIALYWQMKKQMTTIRKGRRTEYEKAERY